MICVAHDAEITVEPSLELERLAACVHRRLGRQVRDLRLFLHDDGLVLQGRVRTYYVKQLVQHAVMQATEYRIRANEIEVASASLREDQRESA
jgi:hypothetical protein